MHLLLWMMKLALKMPLKTYMDQALMGKKLKLNFPNLVLAVEVVVTATVTADMVVTEEVVVDMTAEEEIAIADTVVDVTATEAEAGNYCLTILYFYYHLFGTNNIEGNRTVSQ